MMNKLISGERNDEDDRDDYNPWKRREKTFKVTF